MTDINVAFCRALLAQAHNLVKATVPSINLRADAYVMHLDRDNWEFHGPERFYWYGRADNAFDARYKGWMAWLRKHRPQALETTEDSQ